MTHLNTSKSFITNISTVWLLLQYVAMAIKHNYNLL